METYKSDDCELKDPQAELMKLFGEDYIGCTIRNGELIEFRVKKANKSQLDAVGAIFGKEFSLGLEKK